MLDAAELQMRSRRVLERPLSCTPPLLFLFALCLILHPAFAFSGKKTAAPPKPTNEECLACHGDPKTAPPSYRYFIDIVDRLTKVKPEDLTENSVLLGSPARITEILKKVEAAGFEEVILYFNVGLKPHAQVKDEMARFMAEVAPVFAGHAT